MNRLNRDLLYLGLGIALFTPASIANAKANTDKSEVTRTSEKANLYNKNGKKQISNVKSNSKLEVLGKANDSNLVKVKQGNQIGYIYQQSLKQQTTDNNHLYVVNKAKVHFGSNDSKQTQKLSVDDELKKLGSNKKWTKVKIGNQVGYIKNSAVSQKSRAELDLIKAQKEYNKINHKLQHTKNKKERAKLEKQLSKALKNLERAQKALVKFNNSKMNKNKKSNAKIDNSWINDLINSSSNNNIGSNNQNNNNSSNGIVINNSGNNGQGNNGNNNESGNNDQSHNEIDDGSENNNQSNNDNNNGSGSNGQGNNENNNGSGNNNQSNNGNNNGSGNNSQGNNGHNDGSGNNDQDNNGNNNGSGNNDQGNNETNGYSENNGQNNDKDPDGNPVNDDKNNAENTIDHVGSNGYGQKGTQLYDSENNTQSNVTLGDYNVALGIIGDNGKGRTHVVYNGQEYWLDTDKLSTMPQNFYDDYGYSHFTRNHLNQLDVDSSKPSNQVPNFRGMDIKDIPSAQGLDVWDSWPLQDGNGNEQIYKGYHVVFGLANNPDSQNADNDVNNGYSTSSGKIYMFYQKVGDEYKGINSWHNAGPIFEHKAEGSNGKDTKLNQKTADWSGSSTIDDNGNVRMFYTIFSGATDQGGSGDSAQTLATAKLQIDKNTDGLNINHKKTSDHRSIFEGDGDQYQSVSQFNDVGINKFTLDDLTTRDPHYIEVDGRKYLVFEGNSGKKNGYQGINNFYNMAYFGGNDNFNHQNQTNLINSGKMNQLGTDAQKAAYSNGALGRIELDNNYNLKNIEKPLIDFNSVSDEVERPSLFEHGGKWYLFGVTRGYHFANSSKTNTAGSYMLGFESDSPNGPFKPLNNNGVVLSANDLDYNSRTYTYSYYVLNNNDSDDLVVTSYMTNSGNAKNAGGHSTFAPSFRIHLNDDGTTYVDQNQFILQQGDLGTRPGLNK